MIVLTPASDWTVVTDGVMGGRSTAGAARMVQEDRAFLRLKGEISAANNGGFAQLRCDLPPGLGGRGDLAVTLRAIGTLALHLRPRMAARPWHVMRARLAVLPDWGDHRVRWDEFAPSDPAMAVPKGWGEVLSVGVVAIAPAGPFQIDLHRLAIHAGQ